MDFIILVIFFVLYVVYTEIRIRNIKKQKTKIYVPKELFENLKDTFQYINTTLEMIKEKQENISKLYLKIMDLKKELEQKEVKKNKKKANQALNEEKIEKELKIDNNQTEQEEKIWEKLLEETHKDKIEFSFVNNDQKREDNSTYKENLSKDKSNLLKKMGIAFRKLFNIPEIQISYPLHKDFHFKQRSSNNENYKNYLEKENLVSFSNIIPLEEYQKQLNNQNSQEKESTEKKEVKENDSFQQNHIDRNPEQDPKQILIKEAKKLFTELQSKEEKFKLIQKLTEIGFTEEELFQITNLSINEINLILKLKKKYKV